MTDPIQDAIDKTLGTPKVSDPYAALIEARNLLEAARDQRRSDLSRIAKLAGDFLKADEQCSELRNDLINTDARLIGNMQKLDALKAEVKTLRRVPRFVRWLFGAA